jgi:aldose 1-epimerase
MTYAVPSLPPSGLQVEMERGEQRLTVVEVGGGIRQYSVGGVPVIDGYVADEMCSSGRGQALIPWPNRLAGGSYEFEGAHYQVPLTEPEHGNAIHGLVRFANWVVSEQGPAQVVMAHRLHASPGYPFVLDLELTYTLDDEGLTVTCSAVNRSDRPCPYAAGAHPYLRLGDHGIDRLLLSAPARSWYESDGVGIPVARHPVEGTARDFRRPRPIGTTMLDTAFGDLDRGDDGRATVELAEADGPGRVRCWLDGSYTHLMLFTGDAISDPARRRQGLAIEPMTCAPNAFRSGDGLQVLAPGQASVAQWGISTIGLGT